LNPKASLGQPLAFSHARRSAHALPRESGRAESYGCHNYLACNFVVEYPERDEAPRRVCSNCGVEDARGEYSQ
jgi:hypothetical protein